MSARQTKSARRWRTLIAEQERSGQGVSEFAQRRGMNVSTLYWWRSRLRRDERVTPQIVPIEVVGRPGGGGEAVFELELCGGRIVRVPAGFDEHDLARLIRVLERGAC